MAVKFHNQGRKLLFSELFKDEERLSETPPPNYIGRKLSRTESISSGFSSPGSSLSSASTSPFWSELCSTGTESDDEGDKDDDFTAELTRQMADYMLRDDDEIAPTSPKMDPCGFSSLPPSKFSGSGLKSGAEYHHGQEPKKVINSPTSLVAFSGLNNDQLQDQQFERGQGFGDWGKQERKEIIESEREQELQHQEQKGGERGSASYGGFGSYPSARVPLQQLQRLQTGSGMRAVFLGGSGSKNASPGTGVFLPRGTTSPESRKKKSGCQTVLVPARVMQVLQLHFAGTNVRCQPTLHGNGFMTSYPLLSDVVMPASSAGNLQQKQQSQRQTSKHLKELALPHEWTY